MLLTMSPGQITDRTDAFRRALFEITDVYTPVIRCPLSAVSTGIFLEATSGDEGRFIKTLTDRGNEEWSMLLWPSSSLSLFVAFDEVWDSVGQSSHDWRFVLLREQGLVPTRGAPCVAVFGGLRIRFYLQRRGEANAVRQWLRCEWEPYRYTGSHGNSPLVAEEVLAHISFDAEKAAHPHFHFDSIPLTTSVYERLTASPTSARHDFGSNNFDSFGSSGFITGRDTDLRHVHLPSTPKWTASVFAKDAEPSLTSPLPHQHYPSSTTELDNWFAWNVSYFLDQFKVAIGDA